MSTGPGAGSMTAQGQPFFTPLKDFYSESIVFVTGLVLAAIAAGVFRSAAAPARSSRAKPVARSPSQTANPTIARIPVA